MFRSKLNPLTVSLLLATSVAPSLSHADTQEQIDALEQKINLLSEQLESQGTMGQHAGSGTTSIGGYGELHYNNLDSKKEIDFHRFVLFIGHELASDIRFHSELELEHSIAGDGKPGEIELEQAYIEFDVAENSILQAGLFLVPTGIINETHEPETFYGVERNVVEKNIIPATWWEAGVLFRSHTSIGISYDIALHSGLNTNATDNYKPRNGRQKVAKAVAEDLAITARIKWTGMPGLELGASVQHQSDITQGSDATAGAANLLETHAIFTTGSFQLRALYASWTLDGDGPAAIGADEQTGYYVEPSFRITEKVGVFARYSRYDNTVNSTTDSEKTQTDVGVNYRPTDRVVVKLDLMDQGGTANDEGFNLGIGYSF